jgi:hypothetical protein
MSRRSRLFCITALTCIAAGAAGSPAATAAAPAAGPRHLPDGPLRQISVEGRVPRTPISAAASTTSVVRWTKTVADGGNNLTYTMVGKSPLVKQPSPSTTIKTELVPLVIKFSGGDTWDPTLGDSCDTTSAVTRTKNSPLFKSLSYTLGGTAAGTGQYVDIFQRANYWADTKPTGINPGYHVTLGLTVLPAVTIKVPDADAASVGTTSCGNHLVGAVDYSWLDNYLRSTVLPSLKARGVGPTTFPIFLMDNVVQYLGDPTQCCVLGYHDAFQATGGVQTYAVAMYDNGVIPALPDVTALSHEVAEWMDDPFGDNPTEPWGHIGQVQGCQGNLEVGDPLSGVTEYVTSAGHLYHLQELAFTSWFYHQVPSTGINGWYSSYGSFRTPAAACS